MALRVVLAEDNYLVREGVGKLIDLEDDLEVVAVCADHPSLVKAVDKEAPVHLAQLMTYLRISGKRLGFLINFNVTAIKAGIRRVVL